MRREYGFAECAFEEEKEKQVHKYIMFKNKKH